MSKKVLALVLALVMVLGSFSFVSAASYDDVTGTTYEDAVARLSLLGVLEGYPDGSFKPEGEITRAEFAAVAVRAKGLANAAKVAEGSATGFTDVPANHWASGIIGTAAKTGVVNGIGEGLFAPSAPVKYEEAITMLVRALGYEASAQTKGGYPYGYLIVANEIGLLDEVKGTQGSPASRGIVAQMTDNALEIPLMIQVGFGSETKWVVSGSKEHGTDASEEYLLDAMGFDSVKGRVTNVNSNRKGITVTVEDKDEHDRIGKWSVSIDVPAGFDSYEVEGVESKIWYKGDVVISKVLEEAKYDAMEYIAKDEKFKLITEDEKYEIGVEEKAEPAYMLTIDGEDYDDYYDDNGEAIADYAKIVINNDDEIIWAQGYTFDGFVVVDEVDGFDVISADDYDEVDVKDFLIVKDGKEISVEDLEEGDVLYYNDDEEFAVVYNNNKEGEIERVYADNKQDIRFAGKNYVIADDAIYLNEEGKIGELNTDVLDDIMDEEEEVTIFFNFKNEATVVLAGPEVGTSAYYVMTKNANEYEGRGGHMLALDVRNSEGDKLTFDLDTDFFGKDKDYKEQADDGGFDVINTTPAAIEGALLKGQVLKISVDKDGDPTEVVKMNAFGSKNDIEVDDSKVKATNKVDYKLRANTVVFYDDTDEAILLTDAKDEFSEIEKEDAKVFVEKGYVVAIVGKTNADTDYTTVSGVLKNKSHISRLANNYYEFRLEVAGSTARYITEDKYNAGDISFDKGDVINVKIGDKSGKIIEDGFELANSLVVEVEEVRGNTIEDTNGKEYTFNNKNGQAYKADLSKVRLSVVEGEVVTLYFEGNSNRHVNYVIIDGELDPVDPVDPEDPDELEGKIEEALAGDTILVEVEDSSKVEKVTSNDIELDPEKWEYAFDGNTIRIPVNGDMGDIIITIAGEDFLVVVK